MDVYRKKIILSLKLAFITLLLYFLMSKGFISIQATRQALKQWHLILPAFVGLIITNIFAVFRWQWLLQAQDIHLSWKRVLELTFIGNFFNLALPGAVSGDFVKAFYIGKELKTQKSRAFGSILFDRVAGVSALVMVSALALLAGFQSFSHTPLLKAIQFLVISAATCVVAFYGYLFLVREHHDPLLKILRFFESYAPKMETFTRLYQSLKHYHYHRIIVLKALAVSALIHLTVGWSCYMLALSLDPTPLPLLSVYVVVPLALLVTAIPVAPAGIGTGNVAFLYFFGLLNYSRGADVFSLMAMLNITIGCFGGLVYSRFKTREHFTTNIESIPARVQS